MNKFSRTTRAFSRAISRASSFSHESQATNIVSYLIRARGENRSQGPCGLMHRSTAARPLVLWVRFLPGTLMSVCCEYCVLSGRGLCD